MNNAIKQAEGGVKLTLYRRATQEECILFYDLGALCALQDKVGMTTAGEIEHKIKSTFDARLIKSTIWAGLLHTNSELKIESLNDLVIPDNYRHELQTRLASAIRHSSITEEEIKELAEGLKIIDQSPDPLEILKALQVLMEQEKIQKLLGRTGTPVGASPSSTSGSKESNSGNSQSESSSGISAVTATSKKPKI